MRLISHRIVVLIATAIALVGCDQTRDASGPAATSDVVYAPIEALPQAYSQNEFSIPTGDRLRILEVRDVAITEAEQSTVGPLGDRSTRLVTNLDFWIDYENVIADAQRPSAVLIFYTTPDANFAATEGDYSGPRGMIDMWRRASEAGMDGVTNIEGRTAGGLIAGAIGSIPILEFSSEGSAHIVHTGNLNPLPSLCSFDPRYVGIVLLGEQNEPLSGITWMPVRVSANACQQ